MEKININVVLYKSYINKLKKIKDKIDNNDIDDKTKWYINNIIEEMKNDIPS